MPKSERKRRKYHAAAAAAAREPEPAAPAVQSEALHALGLAQTGPEPQEPNDKKGRRKFKRQQLLERLHLPGSASGGAPQRRRPVAPPAAASAVTARKSATTFGAGLAESLAASLVDSVREQADRDARRGTGSRARSRKRRAKLVQGHFALQQAVLAHSAFQNDPLMVVQNHLDLEQEEKRKGQAALAALEGTAGS